MPFTASLPTLETDILLNAIAKMNWQLMLRKLYKAYRKEMEWDMTYERLDKNLHSVAKGLGEFYLNGTR